ncbi:ABC transporter substrate-binding protein [Sediminicoccus rosea]|jgi:multiple sugar transport system substrate-binding protein|uniref:Extracellular solute-binding protein n=1 Tax=Sediminicoccus rosea TaxID=1225128 RepID=A0ABZ0PPB7_9PROT|nr:extracellular solute-binding protein [Sediminicoccus rosea]WPB87574.1 extracellular solute-binding protein [Sediminicoccus rosea]
MTFSITRRLVGGLGAGLIAGDALAQTASNIAAANVAPPRLPIENGATLRVLRPVRFVQPDEDVFRANAARFTAATGVQVRVDFVAWEDITQQTGVTANTGAGPDVIIGFNEAPHVFQDKLIELTDIAEYLGAKYGGWKKLALRYGRRHNTNNWIGLPFGASGGPWVWRKSALNEVGFQAPPEDHAGILRLCQALRRANKPAGFALGNAVGDGNAFASWLVWSFGGHLVNEDGTPGINSRETIAALNYLRELYPTFIPGTLAWGDISNNRAFASNECFLTQNGVSLYFSMKNDPATAPIAADTEHSLTPKGIAASPPNAGLTLNAMVFRHTRFPNAAKAFLAFMMEAPQYDPWLQANIGYWAQPLNAFNASRTWQGDPKVAIFKDTMDTDFWNGFKGPITEGSAAANADYVMVQMCASVASGQATPEAAAREAERRAARFFRRR